MRGSAIAVVLVTLSVHPVLANNDEEPDADDTEQAPNKPADDEPPVPKKKHKKADAKADDEARPAKASVASLTATADQDVQPPRVILSGELLGAAPLDSGNRELFGMGGGGSAGAEVYASPLLGIHGGVTAVFVGANGGMSSTSWVAGHIGPRLHFAPSLFGAATHNDAWVDAHVTYGSSGGIKRPGFDAGGAVQWEVSQALRVGPMVRYQFGADPRDAHAQILTFGLAVGYGGRTRVATHVIGDRDGDGIDDVADKCPDEAQGNKPDPKRAGCPAPAEKVVVDTDGDGVPDDDDWCPRIPAGPNPLKGQPGCPSKTLARVVDKKIEILQQIFFETDKATIKEESIPVLEAVAGVLKQLGDKTVRIEGHTDDVGDDAYNLDLSKRRARAVALWLVQNGGIDTNRLQTEGYGKSRPLVSGPTADLSQNRRVEFVILDK